MKRTIIAIAFGVAAFGLAACSATTEATTDGAAAGPATTPVVSTTETLHPAGEGAMTAEEWEAAGRSLETIHQESWEAAKWAVEEWHDDVVSQTYAYLDDRMDLEDAQHVTASVKKIAKYIEDERFSPDDEKAVRTVLEAGKQMNDVIMLKQSDPKISAQFVKFEQAWADYEAAVS